MIQKNGDYYTHQNTSKQQIVIMNPHTLENSQLNLKTTGNIKQKIQSIREQFDQIKRSQQKSQQRNNKTKLPFFENIKILSDENLQNVDFQVYIPEQILQLDEKLTKIEVKLKMNEMRFKKENKNTLIQRIKSLQEKLKSILEKSSQIIVNNIQNYCSALDDKDEYLKIMFLREAHSKIKGIFLLRKGMKDQINVLESYITSLNHIQAKIKAFEPIQKTIQVHSHLVQLRKKLNIKIKSLFSHMNNVYLQLSQQIDRLLI